MKAGSKKILAKSGRNIHDEARKRFNDVNRRLVESDPMKERVNPTKSVMTNSGALRPKFCAINAQRHEQQKKDLKGDAPADWSKNPYKMGHFEFCRAYKNFFAKNEEGKWIGKGDMLELMKHLYDAFDKDDKGNWHLDKVETYLTDGKVRAKIKATKEKLLADRTKLRAKASPTDVEKKRLVYIEKMYKWIINVKTPALPALQTDDVSKLEQWDELFGEDEEW
jgi:hypothetical protein